MSDMVAIFIALTTLFLVIKNERTCKNHHIIADAIYEYSIFKIYKDDVLLVTYDDMESYWRTLFRFWDWGYTRILPTHLFYVIKPFIKKGR